MVLHIYDVEENYVKNVNENVVKCLKKQMQLIKNCKNNSAQKISLYITLNGYICLRSLDPFYIKTRINKNRVIIKSLSISSVFETNKPITTFLKIEIFYN